MKNLRFLNAALSMALFFAFVHQVSAQTKADAYLTKEFQMVGKGNLEVETSGASVQIKGVDRDQVIIDMYVKRGGQVFSPSDPEVKRYVENFTLDFSQSGNTVTMKVKNKSNDWWKNEGYFNLAFEIQVPEEISTKFQSSGGSISLENVEGTQSIATSGGSINIEDASGTVTCNSSGGSFSLSDFEGRVTVQSSGGAVRISETEGEVTVNTSGGSVSLEDISGSIDANTSGGSIRAKLQNVENDLSFTSSGGSISALVPEGLGLNLDLRGGGVKTQFKNFEGEVKKDLIVGKLNGGGPLVSMKSSGGSINLEFFD